MALMKITELFHQESTNPKKAASMTFHYGQKEQEKVKLIEVINELLTVDYKK